MEEIYFTFLMKLFPDTDIGVPKIKVKPADQESTLPFQILLLSQAQRRAKAFYERFIDGKKLGE